MRFFPFLVAEKLSQTGLVHGGLDDDWIRGRAVGH